MAPPVIVLLHGFGASLYSWQKVFQPLSQYGKVIAFDRPAFGLTEKPLRWKGQNPYSPQAQMKLVVGILNYFNIQKAILMGHSAGGTLAMQIALEYPERVQSLILVDPAVYNGGGTPGWLRPVFHSPQMRHLGPLLARQIQARGRDFLNRSWHDPSQLDAATISLYEKPFLAKNWDRGLWELTLASRTTDFAGRESELSIPILVITGDDDHIVPTLESKHLVTELPNGFLAIIPNAGHIPHEEKPVEFMDAVVQFLNNLK